ncbi:MAG TPA: DNA repair protein RecN [Anaerolineales bacterium]|nr:DNA repair protein RecN [Anaerolineales bacterium]
MLQSLRIRDFAIIAELELSMADGFVVFSGETGAGKSIIVDAVQLVLGGRADSTVVRQGTDVALVEGSFRLQGEVGKDVQAILEREGLNDEPGAVVLAREVRKEGRSVARVNGRTVSLSLQREIGDLLVDVHGQSEHLSLLRVREHLALLDRFAGDDEARAAFAAEHQALVRIRQELELLRQAERDAARRIDLLAYQIREIEAARLTPGEKESLEEERNRLANAERLAELASLAIAALDDSAEVQPGAVEQLGRAMEAAAELAKVDRSLESLATDLRRLEEEAAESARTLRHYRDGLEFNPRRLQDVETRLGLIHDLERKYGEGESAVLAYLERSRQELEEIETAGERIGELAQQEAARLETMARLGVNLTEARRAAGETLGKGLEAELKDLQMAGARFGVDLAWEDDPTGVPVGERRLAFSKTGLDRAEFLVAPNPGEGLKPLAKIASGGETSRLMLGLKGVLAAADRTPTLIFDEIDQGIGGRVGAVVGEKLWRLARRHQVLCITHLPQLAAFGDQHFRVEKVQRGGRTFTTVGPLTDAERWAELAQMLGGESDANRESAGELLRAAGQTKTSRD